MSASNLQTVTPYRPVVPDELALLKASGMRRWPPPLPEQPIFYPVTNAACATEIARGWNVPASGSGFVAQFQVHAAFMRQYPVQQVGAGHHAEWWVPAKDLESLNDHIVGTIAVIHEFHQLGENHDH